MNGGRRNWFDQGGGAYARFRPRYPAGLAAMLAASCPGTGLAVDVGCGNGQLAVLLASRFDRVLGVDPSADQLAHAQAHPRVRYECAPAERLPEAAAGADLIAVAQAAHWFDLPRFYEQVRRHAVPGGVLALITYGIARLDDTLDERFQRFRADEIGPYWPPERRLVDTGYADLPFPFTELPAPPLCITESRDLDGFLGYVSTWSAVRRAREAGRANILQSFADEIGALWGDAGRRRSIAWPLHVRLGKLP